MLTSLKPSTAKRWPRGQRFHLSARGAEVEATHRSAVQEVRALGRDALDLAQRRWAEPLGLEPCDGVVLSELRPGKLSLSELSKGLEVCGTTPTQVRDAIDRLAARGMVEPVPVAREAA